MVCRYLNPHASQIMWASRTNGLVYQRYRCASRFVIRGTFRPAIRFTAIVT